MNINTPKEEKVLIRDSDDVFYYKLIIDKINNYQHLKVGDVVVNSNNNKLMITYIDEKYKLIYGRKICATGDLSKNITHITGTFADIVKIDEQQINAILLNEPYDVSKDIKNISIAKRKAANVRRKMRLAKPTQYEQNSQWITWLNANFSIGQKIWIVHSSDDRYAHNQCASIHAISSDSLNIVYSDKPYPYIIKYDILNCFNIYLSKPPSYKDFL